MFQMLMLEIARQGLSMEYFRVFASGMGRAPPLQQGSEGWSSASSFREQISILGIIRY